MTIGPEHFLTTITAYLAQHPHEWVNLAPALTLLDEGADLTDRREYRGHATASCVVLNPEGQVLFIHHRASGGKWLLPGGHADDPKDTSLLETALRELLEETGIQGEEVVPLGEAPIYIDAYPIPGAETRGEPNHLHFDAVFVFSTMADVSQLQDEEVAAHDWRDIERIPDRLLRIRVRQVAARLGQSQQPSRP